MTETATITPDSAVRLAPDPRDAALFLDFDGTLVGLAPTPGAITIPQSLSQTLLRLETVFGGRVALVSGRSVADLAALLPGYAGTIYGTHGAERRHEGIVTRLVEAPAVLDEAAAQARAFAEGDPRLMVERKPTGVCIHYRQAPDRAEAVRETVTALAARDPAFKVQPAKMAYELALAAAGKDSAIRDALRLPGWQGATPWHIGDDSTDEDAFAEVQGMGGTGIKVGAGQTIARHRVDAPRDVIALLQRWGRAPE